MDGSLILIISVIVAYLLDLLLGDPLWIPHPIVGFGKAISFFDKKLNNKSYRKLKGGISVLLLVTLTFYMFYALKILTLQLNYWLFIIYNTIFLFLGLANKTLIQETRTVFRVLKAQGIEAGRKQIARLVGRETENLTEEEIKTAALETLSENLSDGVVAPLFFYTVAGIPGMMTYKMINTIDSMIGYKNETYKDFGFFGAKLDDIANFIPARLTAFLMAIISMKKRAFHYLLTYGNKHSSPNAGYPEAALAGILDCQFGGPNTYHGKRIKKPYIGKNNRILTSNDIEIATNINHRVCFVCIMLICIKIIVFSI